MTTNELLSAWPLLLGWPAIFVAVVLAAASAYKKKPALAIIGAILILPISFYFVGSPGIGWPGALPITLLVILAIWLRRMNKHDAG